MKIIIGSKNPAKINAVRAVFSSEHHEIVSADVASGVNEQPFSDEETITGAVNRAKAAQIIGEGEIGIGLEGGVQESRQGLLLCNWGALASREFAPIIAGGARLLLPDEIANRLRAGEELGPVMDEYAKKQNVRKTEGAVGIFTNGKINRAAMFTHIIEMLVGQYEYHALPIEKN